MENWQLTLVILASVFVGALIPLLVMTAIAVSRASAKIAEIGGQLTRTLTQVEIVSNRVEALSRGFEGKETDIADLLTSVGHLAHGLERNMKIFGIFSTILASVGTVVADFVKTRFSGEETVKPPTPNVDNVPENDTSRVEGASP